MGLDVNLIRLTIVDTHKLVAYNAKSRSVWRRSLYCLLKRNDPLQKHLTEEEKHNQCLLNWNHLVASSLGLPDDIEQRAIKQRQEIKFPSIKHAPHSAGYIRSGYGGGINTILCAVIGTDLYYAFSKAKGTGGYIKPNWRRSRQRLQRMLNRLAKTDYSRRKDVC